MGSFLEEVRKVFRAELDHQITLSSNEERIKDIETDAAEAMEDNPNSVSVCSSARKSKLIVKCYLIIGRTKSDIYRMKVTTK